MERPIGKRGQWDGIGSLDSGDSGVGEDVRVPIFPSLGRWVSNPDSLGKISARACADSRKIPPDQRKKCVFVLTKEMSLIGPERPVFHEAFCKHIDGWEQRLVVRPGTTGLAQVQGGYELLPREKVLLDIWQYTSSQTTY